MRAMRAYSTSVLPFFLHPQLSAGLHASPSTRLHHYLSALRCMAPTGPSPPHSCVSCRSRSGGRTSLVARMGRIRWKRSWDWRRNFKVWWIRSSMRRRLLQKPRREISPGPALGLTTLPRRGGGGHHISCCSPAFRPVFAGIWRWAGPSFMRRIPTADFSLSRMPASRSIRVACSA